MEALAKAVVSFLELLEAEGRVFRQRSVAVFECFLLMFFGAACVFFGAIAAGGAVYMWLKLHIGAPASAAVIAVVFVALGLKMVSFGRKWQTCVPSPDAKKETVQNDRAE